MADTITARQGYKAIVKYAAAKVFAMGDITVGGLERAVLESTALSDGVVPFRSIGALGMYGLITIGCSIPYDTANDGCTSIMADKIASTTNRLSIFSQTNAVGTLISGSCYPNYTYKTGLDGLQMLDVTFTFTGALTGSLIA
jgi:hypothetical protein